MFRQSKALILSQLQSGKNTVSFIYQIKRNLIATEPYQFTLTDK